MMRKLVNFFQSLLLGPRNRESQTVDRSDSRSPSLYWPELDILRGIAAVLMIINHLGYKTLNAEQLSDSLMNYVVFTGSFAPVLFFFITGFGYGLQAHKRQKSNHWAILLNKVVILILADSFLFWSNGHWLGLDFFGFIAMSCVVLELIRSSRRSILYVITGLILISALRYGIGPHLILNESLGYVGNFLTWFLGTSSHEGISYPFSPWMLYPILGYILGWISGQEPSFIKQRWLRMSCHLSLLAILPLSSGIILAHMGSPFFRWGTVSFSYCVISFAAILIALACSILINQLKMLRYFKKHLSLPGVSSFAIVPIHYFIIYLLELINLNNLNVLSFFIVLTIALILSFLIAQFINQLGEYNQRIHRQRLLYWGLVTIVIFSSAVVLIFNQQNKGIAMLARTLGQISLCLLFAIRRNKSNFELISRPYNPV
jgi:uncharacterized membrane protein/predicted membrane protein